MMNFKKGLALATALTLLLPVGITEATAATSTDSSDKWELVWSDEFEGNSLDLTKWAYETGSAYNNEVQYYTEDNVSVSNGTLKITAKKESKNGYEYTSGRLETITEDGEALFSTKYGRIEARMKLPAGTGLWPAFWMQPVERKYGTWPLSGEIDIMEARGRILNEANAALHYGELVPFNQHVGGTYTFASGTDITDYHVYAVEWYENRITWFVDGVEYFSTSEWYTKNADGVVAEYPAPFNQEFYLILNLAVGGDYDNLKLPADSEIPATMEVDYVRVYHNTNGYKDSGITKPTLVATNHILSDSDFANTNTTLEYIQDADLSDDNWHFTTNKHILGDATLSKKVINNNTYANISITDGGSQVYAVQLLHGIPLEKGTTYTVKFDAMSPDGERTIKVKAYGVHNYCNSYVASLTSKMQTFEFSFTMNDETDLNAMIQMNLGASDKDIIIGNVSAVSYSYNYETDTPSVEVPSEPETPTVEVPTESETPSIEVPTEPETPTVEVPSESETPSVEVPSEPETPSVEVPSEPETPSVEVPSEPETPSVEVPSEPETPSVEVPTEPETPSNNFITNLFNNLKNWWKRR